MEKNELRNSSCRVAFAAYVNDANILLGKEGALIKPAEVISELMPEGEIFPFQGIKLSDGKDSFPRIAEKGKNPESYLQWIFNIAETLGFGENLLNERDVAVGFPAVNLSPIFKDITLLNKKKQSKENADNWFYAPEPLSAKALFPVKGDGKFDTSKYLELWTELIDAIGKIPSEHKKNWYVWLEDFDSAWATFTNNVPYPGVRKKTSNGSSGISLYDHSRIIAALAVALWRYSNENDIENPEEFASESEWNKDKFLLIQGDFFGIQKFIFATGSQTEKQAAKLLRGRSFYVSLLTEAAGMRILDELSLPPTSRVLNVAGRFLILAPNTNDVIESLEKIKKEFDEWFLENFYGLSGIGLTWLEASCGDFSANPSSSPENTFNDLRRRLFEDLENKKHRLFDLAGENPPEPIFENFLDSFKSDKGVCAIDGISPATIKKSDYFISKMAADQISLGEYLTTKKFMYITRTKPKDSKYILELPVLGYFAGFEQDESIVSELDADELLGLWDIGKPESMEEVLFTGLTRKFINGYIPLFPKNLSDNEKERYSKYEENVWSGQPKTFGTLAMEAVERGDKNKGVEGLMVLKGDIDNLGLIFQKGLENISFMEWSALSRLVNNFFSIVTPVICKEQYPDIYTVFAGGDDFFFIGPWNQVIDFANELRKKFKEYVCLNEEIHFSAGMIMIKPGVPVRAFARMTEAALERAKEFNKGEKNAVTIFDITLSWREYEELIKKREAIQEVADEMELSTSYLYGLTHLARMAGNVDKKPENAIWKSWFAYRTVRLIERAEKDKKPEKSKRNIQVQKLAKVFSEPIDEYREKFLVPLFIQLYSNRTFDGR